MKTLIFTFLFTPAACFAALGQSRDNFSADVRSLGAEAIAATHAVSAHPDIHVDSMQLFGITIKEFSDSSGQVFAFSWKGPHHPGLKGLMADYYDEFHRLDLKTKKVRRLARHSMVTTRATVMRGGHIGEMRGVVYLNGQLPNGITASDLQ